MSTGPHNDRAAVSAAPRLPALASGTFPRLLADVGGTNARFALEIAPGEIADIRVYACAEHAGLAAVIKQFMRDAGVTTLRHAAVAIANPISGDQVSMTNHTWHFSIEATRRALGFETFLVVNDFTALARALPLLDAAQRVPIGGGTARADSVIGLVGAGTGLGVSGLVLCGERWIALASEGGHMSFAPCDAREDCVLAYARRQWEHVSFERVAAGPGIELIYRALAERDGLAPLPGLDTAHVVARARAGEPLACEAVDCFCGAFGSFAGNIAITLGALGGMFIGGGVVPHLGELFARSPFRARFEAKGRFAPHLAHIPTFVITAKYPAFLGASALLEERLGATA